MANGTPALYKPIENTIGKDLSQLYLQGQARIDQIRNQVSAERQAESENLAKQIEKISLTGLQDADKMYNEGANLLRLEIARAHRDNRNGFITKTDATRITNDMINQANLLVNSTELIAQKHEELKEQVKRGEISQFDLEQFQTSYFGNYNAIDGTSVITLGMGPQGLEFVRTYTYPDPQNTTGNAVNGVVTDTITRPLSEGIDPNSQGIVAFDNVQYAKDIKTIINERVAPGLSSSTPFQGGQINTYIQNPINDDLVRDGITVEIDGYTDLELAGVLHDSLGVRASWQNGFIVKTAQQVDARFINPDGTYKFNEFDSNGNLVELQFNSTNQADIFQFNTDIKGNIQLTDDQRRLARAYLTQQAFLALGVDYSTRFGRRPSGRSVSSTSIADPFDSYNAFNSGAGMVTKEIKNNIFTLAEYERASQKFYGIDLNAASSGYQTNLNNINTLFTNYQMGADSTLQTGLIQSNPNMERFEAFTGVDQPLANNKPNSFVEADLFSNQSTQFSDIFLSGGTSSNPRGLELTSLNGNEFETITGIGFVKTDDDKYTIVFQGDVNVGVETTTGGTASNQRKTNKAKIIPAMGYADAQDSKAIYDLLYANFDAFRRAADDKNISGMGGKSPLDYYSGLPSGNLTRMGGYPAAIALILKTIS